MNVNQFARGGKTILLGISHTLNTLEYYIARPISVMQFQRSSLSIIYYNI